MVSLYRLLPRVFSRRGLTKETSLHVAKLTCVLLLFASSWMLSLPPTPAWTLSIVGYAILTVSVAALVAEADWEPRVNFALGLVLLVAPWVLGFAHDAFSTLLHLAGGAVITLLSGINLLIAREDPPWRFGPAAGRRADLYGAADGAADDCLAPVSRARGTVAGHRVRHVLRSRGGRLARAGDQPWKTHSQSRSTTETRRTSVCGARRATKLSWDSGFSTNGSHNAILTSQKLKNAMLGRSWASRQAIPMRLRTARLEFMVRHPPPATGDPHRRPQLAARDQCRYGSSSSSSFRIPQNCDRRSAPRPPRAHPRDPRAPATTSPAISKLHARWFMRAPNRNGARTSDHERLRGGRRPSRRILAAAGPPVIHASPGRRIS